MTLEELLKAQGLTDEQIQAITDGMKKNKIYTASEENLDIRYGKLKTQHEDAEKLIEQLKEGTKGNEELQGKISTYETRIGELQEELKQAKVESALKEALMGAKTDDVAYMAYKLKEGGELELDDKGNIKGIDEKIASLKTKYPTHFEIAENGGKGTQPREIEPKPLPTGEHDTGSEAKDLADACRMYYEDTEK